MLQSHLHNVLKSFQSFSRFYMKTDKYLPFLFILLQTVLLLLLLLLLFLIYELMGVLSALMSIDYMFGWCPWRPDRIIEFPDTPERELEATMRSHVGTGTQIKVFSEGHLMLLTAEPSL